MPQTTAEEQLVQLLAYIILHSIQPQRQQHVGNNISLRQALRQWGMPQPPEPTPGLTRFQMQMMQWYSFELQRDLREDEYDSEAEQDDTMRGIQAEMEGEMEGQETDDTVSIHSESICLICGRNRANRVLVSIECYECFSEH